jgi:arylsulfatase
MEGVSMAYTFAKENTDLPSTRYTQYFEMLGNRALYHDGWIACCRHGRLPWGTASDTTFDEDRWELYNIAEDFSEAEDLAAQEPTKLRQLQDLFFAEAAKYNVLPLDDRMSGRMDVTLRPSWFYGRKRVTFYPGMVRLPEGSAPRTISVAHTVTIGAEIPKGGAEGVLVCLGGDTAGWSLYMEDGALKYHYNWFDLERYDVVSEKPVPEGKVNIMLELTPDAPQPGAPATVKLLVNGERVGEGRLLKQVPGRCGVESLDVGMDTLSAVNKAYKDRIPFPFTGNIEHVTFDFPDGTEGEPTAEERLRVHVGMD